MLLRKDKRIRIEELPFQLLLVLLETPGEIVLKETLHSRLWSDRIYGELDNGLHVAAAKLREALGQKNGATQYIETIRRRGYRFNGEVEPIFLSVTEPAAAPEIAITPEPIPESPSPAAPLNPHPASIPTRPHHLRLGLLSLLCSSLVFLLYLQEVTVG